MCAGIHPSRGTGASSSYQLASFHTVAVPSLKFVTDLSLSVTRLEVHDMLPMTAGPDCSGLRVLAFMPAMEQLLAQTANLQEFALLWWPPS